MSDFQINDNILTKECRALAREIFDYVMTGNEGENPEDYRDDMDEQAHQTADGHEWVIYNYKALMICAHCDVSNGEEFLEDVGMPEEVTIHKLACAIVYGEMRAQIMEAIDALIEEWEPAEEEGDDD